MKKILVLFFLVYGSSLNSQEVLSEVKKWLEIKSRDILITNEHISQLFNIKPDDEVISFFTDEDLSDSTKNNLICYLLESQKITNFLLFDLRGIKSLEYIDKNEEKNESASLTIKLDEKFFCKNLQKILGIKRENNSREFTMFLNSTSENYKYAKAFFVLGKLKGFKVKNNLGL